MKSEIGRSLEGATIDAEALYRDHAPFVAGFLVRLGAPRDQMPDLLQEVFLIAHQRGGFAPGPARPTTWLAEIAFRVCANAKRARARAKQRQAEEVDPAQSATALPSPEVQYETAEAAQRLQRCLDELDDEHRVVLVLYELYEESCADIAAALSLPVGTVHSRLHTARKKVRARYERLAGRSPS